MFKKEKNLNTETEESAEKEQVSAVKRVFSIIKTIFIWVVVVFAVGMMIFTILSKTVLNSTKGGGLFGYKMFIVLSDSMSISEQDTTAEDKAGITFNAGDLIFSKTLDDGEYAALQPGDVITFQSQGGDNFGEVVTHKIRRITQTAEGGIGYVTYGINTNVDDETVVSPDFILGKYSGKIPKIGSFLNFQKTTVGYITCIFVPFVLLIIIQGIKSVRLFRIYKKEQHAELDAEKAELAAQKAETEKMMREMLELKAQLTGQQQDGAQPAEKPAQPEPQPVPVPQPEVKPEPQPQPAPEPAPQPEPQPQPAPEPAPQPEPEKPAEDPLAAEKAALEAQRAETERMMREMMEMKAKLDAQLNKTKDETAE